MDKKLNKKFIDQYMITLIKFNTTMERTIINVEKTEMSQIKMNSCAIVKQRPCKIVDIKHSKTGKHGSMKVRIVGIDCINKTKYEYLAPGHTPIYVFKLDREEYPVMDIHFDDEKYIGFECLCKDASSTTFNIDKSLQSTIDSIDKLKYMLDTSEKGVYVVIIRAPVPKQNTTEISNEDLTYEYAIDSYGEQQD